MVMDVKKIREAIQKIEGADEKDQDFVNFFQSARSAYGLDFMLRYCLIPYGRNGCWHSITYANRRSGICIKPEKMLKKLRECEKGRAAITKPEVLWLFYYLYHDEAFRYYSTKRPTLKMAVTCVQKMVVYIILEAWGRQRW